MREMARTGDAYFSNAAQNGPSASSPPTTQTPALLAGRVSRGLPAARTPDSRRAPAPPPLISKQQQPNFSTQCAANLIIGSLVAQLAHKLTLASAATANTTPQAQNDAQTPPTLDARAPASQQRQQSLSGAPMTSSPSGGEQTAASVAHILSQLSGWEVLLVLLLIALILISIIGNCLVCVAIFTDRRLRKLGNAFIVSLAIADLFVSCLVMTFALANDLMNYWMFGSWFCDIWISFDIMCCTASILNMCAISLDRFIHIKDCLLYNQLMTRRVAISAVIGIWILSALVSFVPINLGWHKPSHAAGGSHLLERRAPEQSALLWPIDGHAGGEHRASGPAAGPFRPKADSAAKFAQEAANSPDSWPAARSSSGSAGARSHNSSEAQADFGAPRPTGGQTSGRRRPSRPASEENYSSAQVESNPRRLAAAAGHLGARARRKRRHAPLEGPASAESSAQWRDGPLESTGRESAGRPATSELPQCMLTLTPTYAIISSTISFYIPCLIMLGLYSKLFACARRHVRNIRAITRAPHPIGRQQSASVLSCGVTADTQRPSSESGRGQRDSTRRRAALARRARTWIKLASNGGGGGVATAARNQNSTASENWSTLSCSAPLACESAATAANPSHRGRPETIDKTLDSTHGHEHEPFLPAGPAMSESRESGALAESLNTATLSTTAGSASLADQVRSSREHKIATSLNPTAVKLPTPTHPTPTLTSDGFASAAVQQQKQQTSQLATHKAAITLGIIMGTFLFCWVPFFCLNIIKAFSVDSIPSSMFRAFTWLGYANSALNPIIYGIHNSEFRNAFNRIFFKHLTLKNGRQYLNRRFSYDLRHHHHHHERPNAQTDVRRPNTAAVANHRADHSAIARGDHRRSINTAITTTNNNSNEGPDIKCLVAMNDYLAASGTTRPPGAHLDAADLSGDVGGATNLPGATAAQVCKLALDAAKLRDV